MGNEPLVSVLVPTYNGARFLEETLESIRVQAHRNIEVIIRDDASTDDTVAIAEGYARRDARFRVLRAEQNGGGLVNHVELLKAARADYIKFCNHDDLLHPDCITLLLAPMLANPRITLATSVRRLIDENSAELPPQPFCVPLADTHHVFSGRDLAQAVLMVMTNVIGEPSTVLFRNHVLPADELFRYGPDGQRRMADVAAWLNLMMRGDLYYHVSPLSSFRQHTAQASQHSDIGYWGAIELSRMVQGAADHELYAPATLVQLRDKMLGVLTGEFRRATRAPEHTREQFVPLFEREIDRMHALV